jgi:hypothetical protein
MAKGAKWASAETTDTVQEWSIEVQTDQPDYCRAGAGRVANKTQ